MRVLMAAVIAVVACGSPATTPGPDASVVVEKPPPESCPERPARDGFDFFGEGCTSQPFPVNVSCHDDSDDVHQQRGWCVEGVCRPQCGVPDSQCPVCPSGTERLAAAGACYCSPE